MSSRVIHTRIKDETLFKLIQILDNNGVKVRGIPASTIVSISCDALVNSQPCADYNIDFDFTEALDNILGVDRIVPCLNIDSLNFNQGDKHKDADNPKTELRGILERKVEALSGASLEIEGGTDMPNVLEGKDEQGQGPLIIDNSKRMPIEKIKKLSPKDRFLEQVDNNPDMTLALEIVYAQLPITDWGMEKAEKLLSSVYNDILKYGYVGEEES